MQHSRGKYVLIFCSTRRGAQEAAQCLSQTGESLGYSNLFIKSMQQYEHLKEAAVDCSDKQLQACIVHGEVIWNLVPWALLIPSLTLQPPFFQ
jgi:ATP-dependent DNA helicase HFM1/MER3